MSDDEAVPMQKRCTQCWQLIPNTDEVGVQQQPSDSAMLDWMVEHGAHFSIERVASPTVYKMFWKIDQLVFEGLWFESPRQAIATAMEQSK